MQAREAFDGLVREIHPQLHRYCARMMGSVVDGEDVVQDALAKAYYALAKMPSISNLRGWLFRIAHNEAIDQLRRSQRHPMEPLDDHPPLAEPETPLEDRELAALAFSLFLSLTPMQRSCVVLKDVLGYSLAEISELLGATVTAIKAALHRGRARLRELAQDPELEARPPRLEGPQAELLASYVERFNARDFDAVRDMLADDVRLDLLGQVKRRGLAEVGRYFTNYENLDDWRYGVGFVEGRPAVLVYDPREPSPAPPRYFVLIEWTDGRVGFIRDYRYAPHVIEEAEVVEL